jgi:hypothetical protein
MDRPWEKGYGIREYKRIIPYVGADDDLAGPFMNFKLEPCRGKGMR